jgi:DNA-nicking Smr family endonuclease
MESRICCRCKIDQPMGEYGVQKHGPNGFRSQCRGCRRLEAKEYRKRNLEKVKLAKEAWKIKNPNYDKFYSQNNQDKKRKAIDTWNKNNPGAASKKTKEWLNKNPHIKIWRTTLRCSLFRMGKTKVGHTIDLLGYSAEELRNHLESLFTDGMSWDNYGEWHIDHIVGVINFDPKTPQSIVNALSNLRPMWSTTREINGVVYEGNLNRPKR